MGIRRSSTARNFWKRENGMEQLSLFVEEDDDGLNAICMLRYMPTTRKAKPVSDWMKKLIPDGKYVVDVGGHPLILRPTDVKESEIQEGHEFYHYKIDGRIYSGIFVGRENG